LMTFTPVGGGVAQAQDEPKEKEGGPAAKDAPKKSTSMLMHIISSAGPVFGPLLLGMSIMLVALIVLLAMDLRMAVALPPTFVEDFTDTVNKKRFKEAFDLAKEDESYLGKVMTAGMSRLQYGIEDAREAAFNIVDSIEASKKQLITYLATIGTLGPLIGLVGTVWGMILAFMELAKGTPDPAKLADAMAHGLVVTMLGIGLAIPAICAHAFFGNRLTRIKYDVSNMGDDLLTQMYHGSKKTPGTPEVSLPTDRAVTSPAVKPR